MAVYGGHTIEDMDEEKKGGVPLWATILISVLLGVIALIFIALIVHIGIGKTYCAGGRPDRRLCRALGLDKRPAVEPPS